MSVINDAQTNRVCALLDHSNIIFLLEYSSVYSHRCFITDARVLEKFVRISGVHTGIRRSK